jgi:hypothetical protein
MMTAPRKVTWVFNPEARPEKLYAFLAYSLLKGEREKKKGARKQRFSDSAIVCHHV